MNLIKTLFYISLTFIVASIVFGVISFNQYQSQYEYSWQLAKKSSDVVEIREHIDNYVYKLEQSDMHGKYNALFYKHPNTSFDYNLKTLKSLQRRIHELESIKTESIEYQLALHQIIQQGFDKTYNFKSVWYKNNYIWLWDWIGILLIALTIIVFVITGLNYVYYYY